MPAKHPYIGANIRIERKHRGWTLNDMAAKTGLSVAFLSDIEVGRTDPSLDTFLAIRDALGVDANTLTDDLVTRRLEAVTPKGQ